MQGIGRKPEIESLILRARARELRFLEEGKTN